MMNWAAALSLKTCKQVADVKTGTGKLPFHNQHKGRFSLGIHILAPLIC